MRNALTALVVLLVAAGCASTPDDALPATTAPTDPSPSTASTAPPTTSPTSTSTSTSTSGSPAQVGPALEAGDHEFSLDHDGAERLYVVHVPPGLVGPPAAVVLSLHGGGGSATQHKDDAQLDGVADREGFVAVYPEGVGVGSLHTWNAGSFCCGLAARTDVDDVGFIATVLSDLGSRLAFDADRVVIAGHSNGSMMALRVAAERPELVAAVVAVAGINGPDVVPGQPVPVLEIHSVDDPRALYEGGEGPPFPGTNLTVQHFGVEGTLAEWAQANGCDSTVPEVAPEVADNGHTATRVEWSGCVEPLVHLRLTGAGHGWPGSAVIREDIVGPATDVIHASEEIWAFAERVLSPT